MSMLLDDPHYTMELTERGIVFVTVRGDVSDEVVARFERESEPHVQRLAPVLYLNDMSQFGETPLSARWKVAELMRRRAPLMKKSAAFGMTPTRRLIAMALLRAAGRADKVRIFASRAEAEAYLLE